MSFVVISLVVPVAIVAVAAWDDHRTLGLLRNGVTASATVTALEPMIDGDGDSYTLMRFRYPAGEWDEPLTGSCPLPRRTHPNAYAVGDRIDVVYRRSRPSSVTVAGLSHRPSMPAALVIAGMLIAIALVAVMVN